MSTEALRATDDASGDSVLGYVRNALKLGGSLVVTWTIALAMRIVTPRHLGPSLFGTLSFADALTTTCFVVLGLGADVYVRKEVAIRPGHASDFFGGTITLRLVIAAVLASATALLMHLTDRPSQVQGLVLVFGLAQFCVHASSTLSALLHAQGTVDGLSVATVGTKLVWAGGVLLAIVSHAGLLAFALAFFASEALKVALLWLLARRHLGLVFRIDAPATKAMLLGSLPYYLNSLATGAYGKLDMAMLEYLGGAREVGWYGAAASIASLTLFVTPLISWVLVPMFSRASSRSKDELRARVCRALELIVVLSMPVSMLMSVGADVWIRLAFGAAFAPASLALRILATTFMVTYLNIVLAIVLVLERPWMLTLVSFSALGVNPVLNVLLVPWALARFGSGGGGVGCAVAMFGTEAFSAVAMFALAGRTAVDRRAALAIGKSLVAFGLVVGADALLAGLGALRLLVDAGLYAAVVVGTRAVHPRDLAATIVAAMSAAPRRQRA